MALPSEVRKTIQALNKKIQALEETKRRLLETFGEPLSAHVPEKTNGNRPANPTAPVPVGQPPIMLSSSEKLVMFLRNHGPATRKEIIERSGVPDGSISYLLKNGKFRQREDEKWEVVA